MRLRSGRSVNISVPAHRPRPRRAKPRTRGNAGVRVTAGSAPGAIDAADTTDEDSTAPASTFTYSPVDAWNPTPQHDQHHQSSEQLLPTCSPVDSSNYVPQDDQHRQPTVQFVPIARSALPQAQREASAAISPTTIPEQRKRGKRQRSSSRESVSGAPQEKKQKREAIATYRNIKVPLNDTEAWRAEVRGDYVPHLPFDTTGGREIIEDGQEDKLVWGIRGLDQFDALLPVSPTSPWIAPNAPWPPRRRYRSEGLPYPVNGPIPTEYEVKVLKQGNEVPWLKPSMMCPFEKARYGAEEQPRTAKGRQRDGVPVSPGHMPTVEEMSTEEFRVFAESLSSPELDDGLEM